MIWTCLLVYAGIALASLALLLAVAFGEDRARQRAERAEAMGAAPDRG